MASVEERLAKVEKEIEELKTKAKNQSSKQGWLKKIEGSFLDDPAIDVQGTAIEIVSSEDGEFFISDWLRNRNTFAFLGIWEPMRQLIAHKPILEATDTI